MVRTVDYEARKRTVLSAAINKYIKEAAPVASRGFAREFGLSSATIRSIFAELEELGYLTHPYTSGGRVPTAKGYRYYVDSLLSQMQLLDEEKERIVDEYKDRIDKIEDVLDRTSGVISAVTRYAGITSFLDWHDKYFYKGISLILSQPEFRDTEKIRLLVKMIEDKQDLLKIINRDIKADKAKVYIGREMECHTMQDCSLIVTSYRINGKPQGRIAVLGPTRMEYEHIIPALEYVSDVVSEVLDRT
ncbi:HrcA family transcriptional regulator [Candidatus Omnitrophota bacterium]